ncbi:hypothetical protein [Stenotrophomonas koreensis]|nr:hypothetical protein [Stenotrophomonas koreensis]
MTPSIPLPDAAFVGPLTQSLREAHSLEELVRPLLQLLQAGAAAAPAVHQ